MTEQAVGRNFMMETGSFWLSTFFCVYVLGVFHGSHGCEPIRIGAFNIQVFGQTKMSKTHVVDVLERITKRYDLLFIQEIRDSSGEAINAFINGINSSSQPYGIELSSRLGRTSSKEQYAFVYRLDKLRVKTVFVYDDSASDMFEREPFIGEFAGHGEYKQCVQPFVVIGIRVRPSSAVAELSNLVKVYDNTAERLANRNAVLMGDFYADCSYVSRSAFSQVKLWTDERFTWLIGNDADTTVTSSNCAYDRLVVAGDWLPQKVVNDSTVVFRFDTTYGLSSTVAREISDRYPVEMKLDAKIDECPAVRIGAFNLQVFGKAKASKEHIVNVLVQIARRYDLLFLQEIRDVAGQAIYTLASRVNSFSKPYALQVSERLGRTVNKEQYAYLYRQDKLQVKKAFVYNDTPSDLFEREPFIVEFVSIGDYKSCVPSAFSVIGCHVQRSNVAEELSHLVRVYNETAARLKNKNAILMGDFNAECSFLPRSSLPSVTLMTDSRFTWLIGDSVDTTTSTTHCAYDRLVVAGDWLPGEVVSSRSGTFRFDREYSLNETTVRAVSNHYPVEMQLFGALQAAAEDAKAAPQFVVTEVDRATCSFLRIGAFNIQVFGQSKASKEHILNVLVRIAQRYDLLFIQEVRDSSGEAIFTLANKVTSPSRPFQLQISERLGRTNSKEQYAFLYRQDKLQVKTAFVYDDSASDVFEREPYVVEFAGSGLYESCVRPFSVIGCHVQPSNVAAELSHLVAVYDHIVARLNNGNSILMGDFNADCSYLPKKDIPSVDLMTDTRFTWLIDESVDTTVAGSHCAYDRLVVAGDLLPGGVVDGSVRVFRFDTAYGLNKTVTEDVSDHYPVDMDLNLAVSQKEEMPSS